MIEPVVEEVARDLNPWWADPAVVRPSPPAFRRALVREISDRLSGKGRLIEVLRGPRQVGKTTALYQIIEDLIRNGTPGRDILFIRFDHEVLRETKGGIAALHRWFEGDVRKVAKATRRPAFLFLDEVHKLPRWDEQVKHVFDTFDVRMLITGSSSVLVSRGGRESLAGRTLTTDFPSFHFREVLEAWHPHLARVLPAPVRFRQLFDPTVVEGLLDGPRLAPQQVLALKRALEKYYNRGGYPRLHSGEVPDDHWADYLVETVFERVLGVDIPDLFPVENPALMRFIYLAVARRTGQEISQSRLAEDADAAGLRTNQPTVGKYLHYLADALLIREFRRYPLAARRSARVPAKITLSDLGVRNAILRGAPSLWESAPEIVGTLVETLVQGVIRGPNLQVHHYREFEDPSDRRSPLMEVDFVAEATDGAVLPIEVKFQRTPTSSDLRGLKHFMARFQAPCGILVTRDERGWDADRRILRIPLLELLLLMGA